MTEHEAEILEVARRFYRRPGAREAAMAELGLSPTRFWQRVHHLLDDPGALEAEPQTVRRLQRLRSQRLQARGHRQVI